jgi:DNA polymerase-3 subunit epsilon
VILFYDTETDGLVHPGLPEDHPSQPHLVQLGCVLADESGAEWASVELIVRPDGYVIPDGAARVHGITTDLARAAGVPLMLAVATFTNLRALAHKVVAHNHPFDDLVMRAALYRTGRKPANPGPTERVCTMELAAPVCAIPPTDRMRAAGFTKYKPPSLMEAHRHLLGEEFQGAHGALADARACMRVFQALKKLAETKEQAS